MANRLMVYVRVKPQDDERTVVDIIDDTTLIFDPLDTENQLAKAFGSKRSKNSQYSFDRVFNERASNYQIYEAVTKPMVDAAINGLNCSVFAYGATGSGKTFTMLGSPGNPGVIYYTSKDLFGKLATISTTDPLPAELKICYYEIYNEKVRDLLVLEETNYFKCGNKRLRATPERSRNNNRNLLVCEGPGDGALVIPDLSYHAPTNADQLIRLLEAGNANRSQHPTDANAESSRSHAIFQIVLTRRTRNTNNGSGYELQTSKVSLIDLAGSERASVAYRAGNARSKNLQREGGNINKSLLALGNCINALADPRKNHKHIPYRDSKLTRLLRDSLGGKCRTAMIATVCQQPSHYDDTQNTLAYASRAKCIKLKPGRNFADIAIQPKNYNIIIENQNRQILTLQSSNDKLKMELDDVRNELNTLRAQQPRFNPHQTFTVHERSDFLAESQYRENLEDLFEERKRIRLALLKNESKARMNQLKVSFKQLDDHRQQGMQIEQSQALRAQLSFYDKERQTLTDRASENEIQINDTISNMATEFEMRGYGGPEDFDAIIEPYATEKERIQEIEEKRICEQHAYDIAQAGINRLMSTENLLIEAANVVRRAHCITKGRGISDQLEAEMTQMLKKLEGKKNVIWKDDKYEMENNTKSGPLSELSSIHDNFSLNFTPHRNNNTLHSRRLSRNLVTLSSYTPEQSNITFDASQ